MTISSVPPQSVIGSRAPDGDSETNQETESTRLYHLSHESAIKSIGLLAYLTTMICGLPTTFGVLAGLGIVEGNEPAPGTTPEMARMTMWLGAIVWAIPSLLGVVLGLGLRRLQVWSRWATIVILILSLLLFLVVGLCLAFLIPVQILLPVLAGLLVVILVQAYLLYILASPKSEMVFSTEYRQVIQQTPWIVSRSYVIAKLLMGLGFVLVALFLIGLMVKIKG